MAERTIAEALFLEADLARHDDLIWFANYRLRKYRDRAPRIDTGEGLISVQEAIDDERDALNQHEDPPLRRVTIDYDEHGKPIAVLEPFTGPFPWEQA